jgi:hypothetical protein
VDTGRYAEYPKCHKALLQQALYPEFPRMRYTGSPVAGNFPSRNRPKKGSEAFARYLTEHEKSIHY